RGVRPVADRLAARLDHEGAVFEPGVLDAIGVELELGVPPAIAPSLPHPVGGVERRAVELVVPHEPPRRRRCGAAGGALLASAARERRAHHEQRDGEHDHGVPDSASGHKSRPSWERTGWDSNPRYPCGHTGFRDRPFQPLTHLSSNGWRTDNSNRRTDAAVVNSE